MPPAAHGAREDPKLSHKLHARRQGQGDGGARESEARHQQLAATYPAAAAPITCTSSALYAAYSAR